MSTKPAKKPLPKIKRHTGAYIFTGVAVIIVAFGSFAAVSNHLFSSEKNVGAETLGATSSATKAYELTVNDVTTSEEAETPDGYVRTQVEISIKNNSDNDLLIAPLLQMHLVDQLGGIYDMTAEYNGNETVGGPVPSGQQFNGKIDFNIPKNTTIKSFTFQADSASAVDTVELNKLIQ